MTAVGAHLVGGLKADTAEAAMRQAAETLGTRLERLTDGETGPRAQWIWWQIDKLLALPGVQMGPPKINPESGNPDYEQFPGLDVVPGTKIPPRHLGYADAAIESYAAFRRLRAEGLVAADVRFQVSLPTAYAVIVAWVNAPTRAFLDEFERAMLAELEAIAAAIPAADLAIQWDVAVEIGAIEGVFVPSADLAGEAFLVEALRRAVKAVKPPVATGIHLCYGDYRHRHFAVPRDLSIPVRLANAVLAESELDFVHMPVDREGGRLPGYFAPLADLKAGPGLALGVIDYENDAERIDALVAAADATGRTYAVATECGMSRLGERGEAVTLADLLAQHARVSAAIR
ncbi:MAG: hypothetical protein MUC54_01400 [Chloroflexi bacterium]|nr:hypothetical protein [Chloroflexota bacterium]